MELKDIKSIVEYTVEKYREKNKLYKKNEGLPEYNDTYCLTVEMAEDISIHAVKGKKPDKLIAKRSPNQSDKEFEYVRDNYKQVTLPVFVDLVSTIQRSFNDNNWSIEYPPDEKQDSLQNYLNEGIKETPLQMSLESWIKWVVPPIKEVDANGCVVVKPYFIPTTEVEGETVVSGERNQPIPYYYSSEQTVAYKDNEYFLFLLKEKSLVRQGSREVQEGLIFEFYDKESIWRITQVGEKKDYQFDFLEYYPHDLGLPVSRLKGIPFYHENTLVWASPMSHVVDILDEAVLDACNLRSIKNKCVYPYRIMLADSCDNTMTIEGQILTCEHGHFNDLVNLKVIPCTVCGGTGRKTRVTPLGEMLIDAADMFTEGDAKMSQPPMQYVSPSIDTPQFLRDEIEKYLNQARGILHLRTTSSEVQPAEETATGQQLDQKAMYAFIKGISDQIFELYEFVTDMIRLQRYGKDYPSPAFTYPVNFDLKGEAEYLKEIGEAVTNGVPQIAVNALTNKYLNSLFYNDGESAMAYEIIKEADRLLTMSDDDVVLKSGRGVIAPYEIILHDSAFTFIKELIAEDASYLTADMDIKVQKLVDKAKTKATEVTPPRVPTNITDRLLGNTGLNQ